MQCHNFPSEYDDHPCVPIQSHIDPLPSGTLRWMKTEGLDQSDEDADVVARLIDYQCPAGQLVTGTHELDNLNFAGIEQCAQPCESIHLDVSQADIFRLILAVLSVFSAIISAFSILIFFRDRHRLVFFF